MAWHERVALLVKGRAPALSSEGKVRDDPLLANVAVAKAPRKDPRTPHLV